MDTELSELSKALWDAWQDVESALSQAKRAGICEDVNTDDPVGDLEAARKVFSELCVRAHRAGLELDFHSGFYCGAYIPREPEPDYAREAYDR